MSKQEEVEIKKIRNVLDDYFIRKNDYRGITKMLYDEGYRNINELKNWLKEQKQLERNCKADRIADAYKNVLDYLEKSSG